MEKRTSAFARLLAALALIGAVVLVVVVASGSFGGSDGEKQKQTTTKTPKRPKTKAATYVVKSGDTLVSIAHRTGIPVASIIALNPDVDPQILIAGETLKLR